MGDTLVQWQPAARPRLPEWLRKGNKARSDQEAAGFQKPYLRTKQNKALLFYPRLSAFIGGYEIFEGTRL